MNQSRPWHEDDDFWETMAPTMFPERRWAAAWEEVDHVIALLGLEPPARILDLCCGPGRHSLELARRGFRVTGVDRTPAYLEKARKQAEAEGLAIEFVQEDMRRFCRPNSFDGAINLFTSFSYFEDPDEDRKVVSNLHSSLGDGARLVMELMGKEVLARIFRGRTWEEGRDFILLQECKIARDWTWAENRWIKLDGQTRKEFNVCHRLYSAAELRALLLDCGFKSVDLYGDRPGAPYDQEAKRLVAVAHKGNGELGK